MQELRIIKMQNIILVTIIEKVMLFLQKSKFLLPLRNAISCNYATGNWYKSMFTPDKYEPPYDHIVQVGDPILRLKADPVPQELIKSEEIKFLLKKMKTVLKDYSLVGMASPQIGISLRIFIISFEEKLKKKFTPEIYKIKEMETLPLTVFINPEIKVINYEKMVFEEGCASISGYSAEVTRSREISISALNESGEKFTKVLKGWNARIAQHENDHLNGVLFTDIMNASTLKCTNWEKVNDKRGRLVIPFYPK